MIGRALQRPTTAGDYANFILACLTHDIGYVRGIVHGDEEASFVADATGRTFRLPTGSSDAALATYRVDRSKLFVVERLDGVDGLDAARIAGAIEYTRFPYVPSQNEALDDLQEEEGLLLRAADLIGQLGDPNYMRKANALFYEFEEIGLNKTLGFNTPANFKQVSTVLLDSCRAADTDGNPLSQRDIQRAAMDSQSLQQRVQGGARGESVRPSNVTAPVRAE